MRRMNIIQSSAKGFTLVELVVCMVILGILSTIVTSFVENGMRMFVDASVRTELSVLGRNLSLRLDRQLARALPYSLNVASDNKSIRFLEVAGVFRVQNVAKSEDGSSYTISFFSVNKNPFADMEKRCSAAGAPNYSLYPAIFSRGDELVKGEKLTLADFSWNSTNSLLSFKSSMDYQSISAGSRLYFLDTCSDVLYADEGNSLVYSVFAYDPKISAGSRARITELALTGAPIQLKNLRFSAGSTAVSYGMLLMSQDQSMPVSKYVEVTNAP